MRRQIASGPQSHPEGWRDGDDCTVSAFPHRSQWYIQVRDGKLVHDVPALLADQLQDKLAGIR